MCSGDSNIVAMNRRVDFLEKKLVHLSPVGSWETEQVGDGFPRVINNSVGAVARGRTQVAS